MKVERRMVLALWLLIVILAWICARGGKKAQDEGHFADRERLLRIKRGETVEQMDMQTYLLGVLRAEMPAAFEEEALKAQAVAARTFTVYHMENGGMAAHPDADACDDVNCCKAFMSAEEAAEKWGKNAARYEKKLAAAVEKTDGEIIRYDGKAILAVFCSSTDGHTQNAAAVWQHDLPYLQSVESPESEEFVPDWRTEVSFTADDFKAAILAAHPECSLSGDCTGWIRDLQRNDAGYVTDLTVGDLSLRASEVRKILGLRSCAFSVTASGNTLTFSVCGYGHGVGMSQYGAQVMALQGSSYRDILSHYYCGTTLQK